MDRTLHNANNAQRILELTAEHNVADRQEWYLRGYRFSLRFMVSAGRSSFREGYLRTFARADKG